MHSWFISCPFRSGSLHASAWIQMSHLWKYLFIWKCKINTRGCSYLCVTCGDISKDLLGKFSACDLVVIHTDKTGPASMYRRYFKLYKANMNLIKGRKMPLLSGEAESDAVKTQRRMFPNSFTSGFSFFFFFSPYGRWRMSVRIMITLGPGMKTFTGYTVYFSQISQWNHQHSFLPLLVPPTHVTLLLTAAHPSRAGVLLWVRADNSCMKDRGISCCSRTTDGVKEKNISSQATAVQDYIIFNPIV